MKKIMLSSLLFLSLSMAQDVTMYVWAKSFNHTKTSVLLDDLEGKNVLISASADKKKLKEFAESHSAGIEILCGYNTWVYKKNRYKIDKVMKSISKLKNIDTISLDVEPYSIPKLKHHREKFLQMYIDMLDYIQTNYPDYRINISIPVFYYKYPTYLSQMSYYADKIYLMAYKYRNMAHLIRKYNHFRRYQNKLVVVFNVKDFHSKTQLNKDIKMFKRLTGQRDIALHSYKYIKKLSNH